MSKAGKERFVQYRPAHSFAVAGILGWAQSVAVPSPLNVEGRSERRVLLLCDQREPVVLVSLQQSKPRVTPGSDEYRRGQYNEKEAAPALLSWQCLAGRAL